MWLYVPPKIRSQSSTSAPEQECSVFYGMLILASRVASGMFRLINQFKIGKPIVISVSVHMVNIPASEYCTIGRHPYMTMQISPNTIGGCIISIHSPGIFSLFKYYVRQWREAASQLIPSLGEHLIDALSCHSKRSSNLGQTMAINVQVIHGLGLFILSMSWHYGGLHY